MSGFTGPKTENVLVWRNSNGIHFNVSQISLISRGVRTSHKKRAPQTYTLPKFNTEGNFALLAINRDFLGLGRARNAQIVSFLSENIIQTTPEVSNFEYYPDIFQKFPNWACFLCRGCQGIAIFLQNTM